jgi:glycine cleavage system aminomethyltransferase T
MSGVFSISVTEARGQIAIPAELDRLAIVIGATSAGTGMSSFYSSGAAAVAALGYGDAVNAYVRVQAAPAPAAGRSVGLVHAGLKALASLRMEKGYRDYGHDIDNTDSVLEAGLGFAVSMKKPGGFLGKEAVVAKKAEGPLRRRLLQVLVKDPKPLMFHAELVLRDGKPVGYVRAASYGWTLGGAVGLAMIADEVAVDQAYIDAGKWEVRIGNETYPAQVSLRPLYDPDMARVKA